MFFPKLSSIYDLIDLTVAGIQKRTPQKVKDAYAAAALYYASLGHTVGKSLAEHRPFTQIAGRDAEVVQKEQKLRASLNSIVPNNIEALKDTEVQNKIIEAVSNPRKDRRDLDPFNSDQGVLEDVTQSLLMNTSSYAHLEDIERYLYADTRLKNDKIFFVAENRAHMARETIKKTLDSMDLALVTNPTERSAGERVKLLQLRQIIFYLLALQSLIKPGERVKDLTKND